MTQGSGMFGNQAAWTNQELPDFTRGVYAARATAMAQLRSQATECGGHGVVGVKIEQQSRGYRTNRGGFESEDLIVTFHVIGTVIREGQPLPDGPLAPALGVLNLS
jgi:uncharacterized protein YbjQ (UPF0145 family)